MSSSLNSSLGTNRGTAYILHNQVTHIRYLPERSEHAFVYPTLQLLLSLKALENGELDLLRGWLFGYGSVWNRLTALRPSAYLYDKPGDARSIMTKLRHLLSRYGYQEELDSAWLMTMPSYLTIEVINPLSVYFCYRQVDPALWVVVLEVHNTFGERHAYVLDAKDGKIQDSSSNFKYEWMFPRHFHVSPFNDRSGFYKCQIIPPSHPPCHSPSSASNSKTQANIVTGPGRPVIKLTVLTTPSPSLPDVRQKKLTALQRTTHTSLLSTTSLLSALLSTPLGILLTFPRILYQAYILHYFKRLDVFQRPEPYAELEEAEEKHPLATNSGERHLSSDVDKLLATRGGIGWQPKGVLERWCEARVHEFLRKRSNEAWVAVELVPANSVADNNDLPRLTVWYRSPKWFEILYMTPTAQHALLLGSRGDRLFSVSDETLFLRVFQPIQSPQESRSEPSPRVAPHVSTLNRMSNWLRRKITPPLHPPHPCAKIPELSAHPHPLDTPHASCTSFLVLSLLFLLGAIEKMLFGIVQARFVKGDEPWGGWERSMNSLKVSDGSNGNPNDPMTRQNGMQPYFEEEDRSEWREIGGVGWVGSVRKDTDE